MSEQDEFLKDLVTDQQTPTDSVLDAPIDPVATPEVAKEEEPAADFDEIAGIKPKTRRERRLLKKIEGEREANIFQAGKLAALSDARTSLEEESDYLKSVERIYGTDTPEAQTATELLKKAIVGARDDAESRAIAKFREERQREAEAERREVETLDGFIEDIEDESGVTLTDAQQRAFFDLMAKMSPKDESGEVVEYADPHAVWEVLQERIHRRAPSRAKDLSDRSMVQSGASAESNLQDDAAARYLRDNGII